MFSGSLRCTNPGLATPKLHRNDTHPGLRQVKLRGTTKRSTALAIARSVEPRYATRTREKELFIRSFSVSKDEILAWWEKATGSEWTRKAVNLDDAVKDANEKQRRGYYVGLLAMIRGMMISLVMGCNFHKRGAGAR